MRREVVATNGGSLGDEGSGTKGERGEAKEREEEGGRQEKGRTQGAAGGIENDELTPNESEKIDGEVENGKCVADTGEGDENGLVVAQGGHVSPGGEKGREGEDEPREEAGVGIEREGETEGVGGGLVQGGDLGEGEGGA